MRLLLNLQKHQTNRQGLVVNAAIQVLDIDIARAALPKARIALTPHNAACTTLDAGVIQGVQGPFSISDRMT